jgi:putrescine transport system substrate-binding protein
VIGRWLTVLGLCFAMAQARAAEQPVVNVFNWSDYVAPGVLDDFTRETGIKVVYDTYDSNETLETKLLAGHTGYDVVVPSATFLQRQIAAHLYQKLDPSKLPNWKNLWPQIMSRLATYDPGNQYAVNYMWFTTGIAFNAEQAQRRLGADAITSWDDVFKPDLVRRFADCGVYMLDSPEDMFASALRYLGLNPDSKALGDIHRAAEVIDRVRRSVKKFNSSEYINALANGDICLAVAWSGDAFQARARAKEAGNGVDVRYVIPREGALLSLDNLAIPADAPHPDAAYRFINFLLRPDIAARNTNETHFANGVVASKPLVNTDILRNPAIYPDDAAMKRLFTVTTNDLSVQRSVTREWTRVKTGR